MESRKNIAETVDFLITILFFKMFTMLFMPKASGLRLVGDVDDNNSCTVVSPLQLEHLVPELAYGCTLNILQAILSLWLTVEEFTELPMWHRHVGFRQHS